jgi:two-component system copper resistance phosphate regulon response regulator CusR
MRILLVEDEPDVARMLAKGLREQSYAVDVAADGDAASYQAQINDYDLIILDVMLPHKDGLEVCRELRSAGSTVPVLMLTARDAVQDRIAGLDSGADDYLIKPFDFHELLARARWHDRSADGQRVCAVGIFGSARRRSRHACPNRRACLGRKLRSVFKSDRSLHSAAAAQD